VYAVGHASGARYLQTALCDGNADFKPSELFRAVAFQGAMYDRRCTPSNLFPTLFIHSVHDTVASQLGDELDNSGALQVLLEANGCEAQGTARTGSCSATNFECVDHDGCSAPFRACIHDKKIYGGDDWPCFATEEIYEFLEEQR
jgi:poly(3-hydroxybutyrate) depolymerase